MMERLRSMASRFFAGGHRVLAAKWAKATAVIFICLLLFCTGLYLGLRSASMVQAFPPASLSDIPATKHPVSIPSVKEAPKSGDEAGGISPSASGAAGAGGSGAAETGTGKTATREPSASSGGQGSNSEGTGKPPGNPEATGPSVRPRTLAEILKELSLPVDGQPYRKEGFYYLEAFSEWKYHPGVDFKAAAGQPVKASLPGTVTEVYRSPVLGTVVRLSHEGGVETRYGCITPGEDILPGKEVAKGDVIGWVSDSGPREGDSEPHLHFEVHSQGKAVFSDQYLSTR